ncbi:MAG TPA: hypothetical protein PKZ52_06060 [Cellvibrionaceae bacterium]|nr:hypothetical protein [Cellvibrionaceae bacterium]
MRIEVLNDKNELKKILSRVVLAADEKAELLAVVDMHPSSIPLKAVLEMLQNVNTLPLSVEETDILDGLKFIYI